MPDHEKVVLGLEHCSEDGCKGCPYEQDCKMCDGFSVLAKDALELINYQDQHIEAFLRDQEPIAPRRIDGKKNHFIKCGNCNIDLMTGDKFCPKCGRAVKWDEAD